MPNRPPTHKPLGSSIAKRDDRRGSAHQRGYTVQWRRAAKAHLASNPLCVICEREGRLTAATCVDHIVPHKGSMERFWDEGNWQSLCKPCHDAKTGREG